jgi:hypothetical protein
VSQLHDAVKQLIPLWIAGRRCSRPLAESISESTRRTQGRNTQAAKSHRKTTIRRLHEINVRLGDCRRCYWPRE